MRWGAAVICASVLGLATCVAPALGTRPASPVETLPFSIACTGARPPHVAPVLQGEHARFAVPADWRTGRSAANDTASGGGCGQPYVVVEVPGDADDCLEQTVYASAGKTDGETPASFLGSGYLIVARGRLSTVAGMHGIWEELEVGVTPAYPSYAVDAVYALAHGSTYYELSVFPRSSYTGACRGSGPRARGVARQLVQSFRVEPAHHG
jgi:hypothetical protein